MGMKFCTNISQKNYELKTISQGAGRALYDINTERNHERGKRGVPTFVEIYIKTVWN